MCGYYMEVVAVRSRVRMAEQPGLHLVVGLEEEEEAKKQDRQNETINKTTLNI